MEKNLQFLIRLNEQAEIVHKNKFRVAVLLEGRDGAGKSGTIRELTRYLPPYAHRIVPSFMPTKRMMKSWLAGWSKIMPKQGEIVFMTALTIRVLCFNLLWVGVLKTNMITL